MSEVFEVVGVVATDLFLDIFAISEEADTGFE